MVHTVGIVGINGNVGKPTVQALIKAAEDGLIRLVLFHRPSTDLSGLSKEANVDFRIFNFDDPPETLENAVKGIQVFISAFGVEGLMQETKLVDALSKSKDLVTYIPPTYTSTWNELDRHDELLGPIVNVILAGRDRAKELGVATTPVYTGVFDNYFFQLGYLGAAIKDNEIWANAKQLKNRVPITVLWHLGDVLARLATSDPQSIKNKEFSVVTFWPSGEELIELYTKVNGKQAHHKDFTKAEYDERRADVQNFGAIPMGYMYKWENASYEYDSRGRIVDDSYGGPDVEQVARSFA